MKEWSPNWKASSKPRKQHAYTARMPLHLRGKLLSSHLSKDLRKKYKKRAVRVRNGDTVKILRGTFKGKTGKIERIDTKKCNVYVAGIEYSKKDGSKALRPVHPSKILIIELTEAEKRFPITQPTK